MRKFLLISLTLMLSVGAFAQKQSLGVQVGFAQPILRENSPTVGSKLNQTTTLNGGKIGIVYDATLIKGFGFTMGVNYMLSGNHTDWRIDNSYGMKYPRYKYKNVMHTLEIPIDWQYKFEVAKQTYLIIYTGPSIKWNFLFKRKETTQQSAQAAEVKTDWLSLYNFDRDDDGKKDYSPINISWNLGAGFQYKNYYLRGGYDFGIYYPYKDAYYTTSDNAYKRKGRFDEWSIKLGIYFLNF